MPVTWGENWFWEMNEKIMIFLHPFLLLVFCGDLVYGGRWVTSAMVILCEYGQHFKIIFSYECQNCQIILVGECSNCHVILAGKCANPWIILEGKRSSYQIILEGRFSKCLIIILNIRWIKSSNLPQAFLICTFLWWRGNTEFFNKTQ